MGPPWSEVYELLLLTAQRRSEVAEAGWSEFDLDGALWTIPAERSKNGLAHLVPLAPRAVEILRKLPSKEAGGLLFPADRSGEGAVSGFSKAKVRLDRIMLEKLQGGALARGEDLRRVELGPWVVHDLRRTAASGMARLGHGIHVVERALNHTQGATTGGLIRVYQKHDFLAERRAALEAWARQVEKWGAAAGMRDKAGT
jgi:integrase